jgi:hypothetical protein
LERAIAGCTALAIVATVIFLAVRNQPIVEPNVVVMLRILLSLAVAVLGATIPGFLQVGWNLRGATIRAGGALALFVLCFFGSPPIIQAANRSLSSVDESLTRIAATTDEEEVDKE